ncbi:MAG: hypothetical protein L6R39_002559 [Caloplaca ligustica]|nr:MAG: hypothetical protein L6R39_002559 [Caloplaca ligustica]
MAFTNQFALTLELTRLLPPIRWATSKAGSAIISRARDLRQSGSDIVVEEDLASVFGRCRISPTLASSFKTIVTKSSSNVSLLEGIILQGGPGPTVARALQESPYFAMVVQLSFLVWAFPSIHMATAIADALRKRSEGAPTTLGLPSSPDIRGILGVLRACESQTSAFNWNMILDAVSTTLGYQVDRAPLDIPPFVLQGLIDMFPMVQSLPSDRFVHIQIPVGERLCSGVSALVVWAHHVLDLAVLVRPLQQEGQSPRYITFGDPDLEQVFIEEVDADKEAFITLLDSQKEHLLTIKLEPDAEDALIGSMRRTPVKGWGNALLAEKISHLRFVAASQAITASRAVVEELQLVTSAFAFIIAKNLIKGSAPEYVDDEDMVDTRRPIVYDTDEHRLLQASRFLFDNPQISRREIDSYVAQYQFKALDEHLPIPPAVEASARAFRSRPKFDNQWSILVENAKKLGIFLIALANITNPGDCEDFMFDGRAFHFMIQHPLFEQLREWNGKDALGISDDAWLQALAVPLLGYQGRVWDLPWGKVCLVSDRGWSAWISTFGDADPSYVREGSITLGRGSPCRNGIWKVGIWDSEPGRLLSSGDSRRVESCGETTFLRCADKVIWESPYCGEGEDVFVVSARFRLQDRLQKKGLIHRFGYKTMQKYLWQAQRSISCSHGSRSSKDVKLAVGCATVAGFGHHLHDTGERILIFLTAQNRGARWLALAAVPQIGIISDFVETGGTARRILLRGEDCCYQCVIDQAASRPGMWSIIL